MKSFQWLQELKGTDTCQKQGYEKNKTEIPNLNIINNSPHVNFQKWGK